MRNHFAALALACAFGLMPLSANAQMVVSPEELPPPGAEVSAADARDMAVEQGLRTVERLHFDSDEGRWEIGGHDYRDNWVDMEVDANTGVILKLDR